MKTYFLAAPLAFALTLAGCGGSDVEQPDDGVVLLDDGGATGPTGPGTWEVLQDGQVVGTTRIENDGRYTETYADGSQIMGRTRRDGENRICFDPDDGAAGLCFSEGDVQSDGSFEVVADDGSTATVRPAG